MCGHLNFESPRTAQDVEFMGSFHSSYPCSLNIKKLSQETKYLASIRSDTFIKCICRSISCAIGKWSLNLRWHFISTFTELHVQGDKHWAIWKWRQRHISAVSWWLHQTNPHWFHLTIMASWNVGSCLYLFFLRFCFKYKTKPAKEHTTESSRHKECLTDDFTFL